jgi:hypothetical protein
LSKDTLMSQSAFSSPRAGTLWSEPATTDALRAQQEAAGRDAVELYVRTYTTILRSSGDVRLRAFEPAHINMRSSLHYDADRPYPDPGAFIYAVQRLPLCMPSVERIVLGQLPEHFAAALGEELTTWQRVTAPGRRREWRFDGRGTLATLVASPSDLDDVIPTLVAYQIEWNKLHRLLQADREAAARLQFAEPPDDAWLRSLGEVCRFPADDWERPLRAIAAQEKDMRIRLLGGTHVAYARLTRQWWQPIAAALAARGLERRPVYFVSSNLHGVVNLVSGYARRRAKLLWEFLDTTEEGEGLGELATLRRARESSNIDNVLYYAARLWHRYHPDAVLKQQRTAEEEERGITTIFPISGIDVGAQIIELARLRPEDLDPRLHDLAHALAGSSAIILNIDYPLGFAAYHILREVTESLEQLRGVYILGKAATLNGAIGDVLISDVVFDEHSKNVYTFPNAFNYTSVAPFLERGSVLDNQKAVTVKGTFLQNRAYLDFFYRESYTVVEMEAGPYLSAIYEATYPSRYPLGEGVHFRTMPFDFGLVHYASDTPYTRARTLGARSLSFEGVDSTYASTVAILRRILALEGTGQRESLATTLARTPAG